MWILLLLFPASVFAALVDTAEECAVLWQINHAYALITGQEVSGMCAQTAVILMAKKPEYAAQCSQCRFCHTQHPRDQAGYCRRYPPIFIGLQEEESGLVIEIFQQPIVAVDEWCGEFVGKQ